MSLARRLFITTAALTAGLLLLALTPVWVMHGIRTAVSLAYNEYKELRMVDAAAVHLRAASGLLHATGPQLTDVETELGESLRELDAFLAFQRTELPEEPPDHEQDELTIAIRVRTAVHEMLTQMRADTAGSFLTAPLQLRIESALADLKWLSGQTAREITESQERVLSRIEYAILISLALAALTFVGVFGLSLVQYTGVICPLRRLSDSVRRIAKGDFSTRVEVVGKDELAEVSEEFNRMTGELDTLYKGLEEKIRSASKELARSERLASVGFLAAGVAHEINNPLNVISGHAELILRKMEKAEHLGSIPELTRALAIIRDEAFRCKQIVEKLLSLARMGSAARSPVNLADAAKDVIYMVRQLERFERCDLTVKTNPNAPTLVLTNESELKQVILNLVFNALEAVDAQTGRVELCVTQSPTMASLTVQDNGRGIAPDKLDRVFEPFFSERKTSSEPGVGLGLSISYAIVQAHGGRLRGESQGIGQGSRFVLELPLAPNSGAVHEQLSCL